MNKNVLFFLTIFATAMSFSATEINASLIGDTVTFEWVIRIPEGDFTIFGPESAVVGAGAEIDGADFTIDFDASSILVTSKVTLPDSAALDWIFSDLDWLSVPGQIDDAQLTLLQGQPPSAFSIAFTNDSVTVNNDEYILDIVPGDFFRIDLEKSHTPEPTSFAVWSLLVVTLTCGARWRRRR